MLAALGTLIAPAASAAPASVTAAVYVRSEATNLCLTAYTDVLEVQTTVCQGFNEQKWEWVRSAQPEFGMLRNVASGRCLDANTSGAVYSNSCNINNTYQWWARQPDTSIRHGASGRYLDSNAAGDVYTLPRNGSAYQRWY
ncbi:hypothetical protein GCM10009745_28880 [Kribbella yunnanensis]|uniref:Ricin B lectin domain-containing protein n=2 Tax=Kribbella yunnanensis TaxID=190194 RepID=A0ABN2H6H5_9ACTN